MCNRRKRLRAAIRAEWTVIPINRRFDCRAKAFRGCEQIGADAVFDGRRQGVWHRQVVQPASNPYVEDPAVQAPD